MAGAAKTSSLHKSVIQAMEDYFTHLDGQQPNRLYEMVLREVERPLLEIVLKHTANNQSLAAEILGISRGTLRKKLKEYF